MKPLWYLTYKTFLNGTKRALSSPRRLIGLLFFAGYYFMFFIRPAMMPSRDFRLPAQVAGKFDFPPLEIIDAFAFTILAALSMFMMLGVAAQQAAFKPADVDILFPTPIKPRLVLLFRIARDYLFTLLLPFLLAILGLRPVMMGWEAVFRNMPHPEYSTLTMRALMMSWSLMAMCWVTITYAISLLINRSDLASTRNKRILGWSVALLILGTLAYIVYQSRDAQGLGDVLELARSPFVRTVFFTATLANLMVLGPLDGNLAIAAMGAGGLLAIIGGALYVALTQAGWMYDQAAVKGFDSANVRLAQRRGDTMGAMAEMARQGKIKAGRRTFVHRLKMRGPWALMWKEFFLQTRGMLGMLLLLGVMGVGMSLLPAIITPRRGDLSTPAFFFTMQATALFMMTIAISQTGFIEVLRRVDLQKPLPFSAPKIVLFEVASKALLGIVVSVIAALSALVLSPPLWPYVLAALIYSPSLSLLLSSTVFLTTIMFPDVDDPTQRQFRGIVMMLAIVILGLPPTGAFLIMLGFGLPAWSAAVVGAGICLGMSALACVISGKLYESYNPSE
jgi:hypothetical protein